MVDGFIRRLHARGVHVLLCGVRSDLHRVFEKTGLVALIRADHVYREAAVRQTSTTLAMRHAYRLIDAPCAACPRHARSADERKLATGTA